MPVLDPKDLVDVPGAGRAEVALRACGFWDDAAACDARWWSVWLVDVEFGCAEVEVRAVDKKGAIEQAWQRHSLGRVAWDCFGGVPEECTSFAICLEDLE